MSLDGVVNVLAWLYVCSLLVPSLCWNMIRCKMSVIGWLKSRQIWSATVTLRMQTTSSRHMNLHRYVWHLSLSETREWISLPCSNPLMLLASMMIQILSENGYLTAAQLMRPCCITPLSSNGQPHAHTWPVPRSCNHRGGLEDRVPQIRSPSLGFGYECHSEAALGSPSSQGYLRPLLPASPELLQTMQQWILTQRC